MSLTREQKMAMLQEDLEEVLEHARRVFRHYRLGVPKITLLARDPAIPGMIHCITNDDPKAAVEQLNANGLS